MGHDANQPPVMIAAFEGWNDAGNAATAVIDLLIDVWEADELDALDAQDYYDFQVNRPVMERDEEGVRRLLWPGTVLWSATMPSGRQALLVRGAQVVGVVEHQDPRIGHQCQDRAQRCALESVQGRDQTGALDLGEGETGLVVGRLLDELLWAACAVEEGV